MIRYVLTKIRRYFDIFFSSYFTQKLKSLLFEQEFFQGTFVK